MCKNTVVSIIKDDLEGETLGYRIINHYTEDISQVSKSDMYNILKDRPDIITNWGIVDGELVATNGVTSNYPIVSSKGMLLELNNESTVIGKGEIYDKDYYLISSPLGELSICDTNYLSKLCVMDVITNAKMVRRKDKYYVSSLRGSFDDLTRQMIYMLSTLSYVLHTTSVDDVDKTVLANKNKIKATGYIVRVGDTLAKNFSELLYGSLSKLRSSQFDVTFSSSSLSDYFDEATNVIPMIICGIKTKSGKIINISFKAVSLSIYKISNKKSKYFTGIEIKSNISNKNNRLYKLLNELPFKVIENKNFEKYLENETKLNIRMRTIVNDITNTIERIIRLVNGGNL